MKLRQTLAGAIAAQQHAEQKYNQALAEANRWQQLQQRIEHLVSQSAYQDLMYEAQAHQKTCEEKARRLKAQIEEQTARIERLNRTLVFWESYNRAH